jgi:hypothetical protein
MNEGLRATELDGIGGREVRVEIGVGHMPFVSVPDRLKDTHDIDSGRVLHVSLDETTENLSHVTTGSVASMDMATFAKSDFLDGKVSVMYIFNVFGEPKSTAAVAGFDERTLSGLKKKLKNRGVILIGEHITPSFAGFMKDTARLKSLGFEPELFTSPIAIEVLLKRYGFEDRYIQMFIQQSLYHKQTKGSDHAGFLLVLTNVQGDSHLDSSVSGV